MTEIQLLTAGEIVLFLLALIGPATMLYSFRRTANQDKKEKIEAELNTTYELSALKEAVEKMGAVLHGPGAHVSLTERVRVVEMQVNDAHERIDAHIDSDHR
jgi:hypothetical protein